VIARLTDWAPAFDPRLGESEHGDSYVSVQKCGGFWLREIKGQHILQIIGTVRPAFPTIASG
jgi:hypothetical protein